MTSDEKRTQRLFTIETSQFRFVRRVNRFVAEVSNGKEDLALVRNTGRLLDLLVPNARCLCVPKTGGKTSYTLAGVLLNDTKAALIDPGLQSRAFETAAERGLLPWLRHWSVVGKEVKHGDSRIDYVIGLGKEKGFLETKSAAYFTGYYSSYPDCPSDRGQRHIKLLSSIAKKGQRAIILFVAAHPFARAFSPNFEQDPRIPMALREGKASGLEIHSIKIHLEYDGSVVMDNPNLPVEVREKSTASVHAG